MLGPRWGASHPHWALWTGPERSSAGTLAREVTKTGVTATTGLPPRPCAHENAGHAEGPSVLSGSRNPLPTPVISLELGGRVHDPQWLKYPVFNLKTVQNSLTPKGRKIILSSALCFLRQSLRRRSHRQSPQIPLILSSLYRSARAVGCGVHSPVQHVGPEEVARRIGKVPP